VRAAGSPVLQIEPASGERLWLVARHRDVLEGLGHPGIGHRRLEPASRLERLDARQLINLDPPEHTRLRGLVARAFTPRRVAGLEGRITAIVDGLLEAAAELGEVDGVADLAEPMPVAVIAELIGVPAADRRTFRAWSAAIMSGDAEARDAATLEFADYIDDLAARPGEGLIAALAAIPELEREDLVAMIQLLLIAGQETAVFVIANGLRALLEHPEQWRALCAQPGLAGAAVEEAIRFDGPVEIAPPRLTLEPVRLGVGTIPAGERVGLALLGANRDPEAFEDPDVFDIARRDLNRHLGFGHGIHFCLGAGLGRLEARVMFRRLAERLPGLRTAGAPEASGWIEPHSGRLPLLV
jgi:cytochrome P450